MSAQQWLQEFGHKQTKKTQAEAGHKLVKKPGSQQSKMRWQLLSSDWAKQLPKPIAILLTPFTHPIFKYVAWAVACLLLVGMIVLLQQLPSPRRLTASDNFAVSTLIYDRNGELLYEIFGEENRVPIQLEEVPAHLLQATVAIEDQNFYRHWGFDLRGIIRAVRNNLTGQSLEGGSTITQQLVKNALLSRERTLQRKAKELVLAILTELLYSKEEILEMYLNYIPYGGTAVGIQAAAQKYFDQNAADLTLAEASLLAGLPQAPSHYSPFTSDPQVSKDRQAEVLRRMAEDGYITPLQAEAALGQTLQFALSQTDIKAPHFVFYVRDLLYDQYGVEAVEKSGLRVYTTLDLQLQQAVQASVSAEVQRLAGYRVSNGAALVTKPSTGEILSMVGSKDYFDSEIDGQVNIALRSRQPGSSIKPLMYATTFQQKKLNPGSILLDVPTCFEIPGQPQYCPKNYDGTFKGPVTVRRALGNSLNIPAVKSLSTVGVKTFMDQAQKMGITTWDDPANYGLSLTLGGGEVRMIDMVQAFAVLANQGVKMPLTTILKVEDYTGEVLQQIDPEQRRADLQTLTEYDQAQAGEAKRVMARAPAYLVSHIMQDNNARIEAFGPNSELVIPDQIVSAKTGTTNDLKDNWTIGFTPEFLTVTWVGNNDNTPMNPYLVSGVTGAAPIWHDIMSYILADQEPIIPDKPRSVARGTVCADGMPVEAGGHTGTDPGDNGGIKTESGSCKILNPELYWEESQPSVASVSEKEVWIKPETGLPPEYGEEAEGLVLETHTLYQDPVTEVYCADCSRSVDEEGNIQYEQQVVKYESLIQLGDEW